MAPRTRDPPPGTQDLSLSAEETGDHATQSGLNYYSYIPVQRGFLYLIAIMAWATRYVLTCRLSNTLDARFCVQALREALSRYGKPDIFNTDQPITVCKHTNNRLLSPLVFERQQKTSLPSV